MSETTSLVAWILRYLFFGWYREKHFLRGYESGIRAKYRLAQAMVNCLEEDDPQYAYELAKCNLKPIKDPK